MPFTPLHLGVGAGLGLLCFRWLDFPTFLAANVVVDARAVLVFFGVLSGPIHGPLHTLAVGTLLAAALAVLAFVAKPGVNRALRPVGLAQPRSTVGVAAAALTGVYAHVALDATLYADVRPFYPFPANPLLGVLSPTEAYLVCVAGLLVGVALYAAKVAASLRGIETPLWPR
ncbi:hypothetical protein [Halorussus marinus]|uniref:hypothetical protein n=1 Tax=Halorussus marinus TaxID=2505976 RepID=UPI00106E0845|nr:hypothetical protein [Halorussus marinus]